MFVLADSNPAHVAYSVEIFPLKAARIFVGHCGFPKTRNIIPFETFVVVVVVVIAAIAYMYFAVEPPYSSAILSGGSSGGCSSASSSVGSSFVERLQRENNNTASQQRRTLTAVRSRRRQPFTASPFTRSTSVECGVRWSVEFFRHHTEFLVRSAS
ncbi:hypothetical protein V9T40_000340 [Parthenolecanium corni]|uniref:Uncharacterized protein n=1 Tax=Parthenolecanium corni TaxID=536013 RepID=A0AAN9TAW6_9HEMI